MCPGLGIALRLGRFFLMLWPDIIQFGRITSDVVRGMSVTDSTTVGHIVKVTSIHIRHLSPSELEKTARESEQKRRVRFY